MSLIETLAKHMLVLPDTTFNELLNFLDAVEVHGKTIKTVIDPLEEPDPKKTVTYEAKLMKRMFLRLRE
jgi:tetratricopeptide repeat protein 30